MPREFKRAVLKLSGEALREDGSPDNISPEIVETIAKEIKTALTQKPDLELMLVVGGGNFWRGISAAYRGMDRPTADHVGMLATVMNALSLMAGLEDSGIESRVMTAIEMKEVAEPYILRRATRHLERGRVVICGAGTGNPFFSTDTTVALRANEVAADVVFKGTKVDGVYDKDPNAHDDAKRYQSVSYQDCLSQNLKVMDSNAFALCQDNNMPIIVFDMMTPGNIAKALIGEDMGTVVSAEPSVFA